MLAVNVPFENLESRIIHQDDLIEIFQWARECEKLTQSNVSLTKCMHWKEKYRAILAQKLLINAITQSWTMGVLKIL